MTGPLSPEALRRICPVEDLPFETTDDLAVLDEPGVSNRTP